MDAREDEPARPLRPGHRLSSQATHLECARCGARYDHKKVATRCRCGGTLLVRYELSGISKAAIWSRPPDLWRWAELLPPVAAPVTLGERQTALLSTPMLSGDLGVDVYVKDDGGLPGGTFKARGAAVALSQARELGIDRIVMPSAGNAGGTWALYAARAGLALTVVMARGAPDTNKAEVRVAGADLELVEGTIADAGQRARSIAAATGAFFAATFFEPYRLEGKKTAWFEVFDAFGGALPRTILMPVGGGVALVAAAKAAAEATAAGLVAGPAPVLVGVQAAACAPIARAFDEGRDDVEPWPGDAMTVAAGLRVPAPVEGALVLATVRESGGSVVAVSEDEIMVALRDLASTEGIVACPEGAATLAAARRLARQGRLEGPVVLYNTGSGLKYPDVLSMT